MCIQDLDHILPLVEKPSRYIGGEINTVRKSGDAVALSMALAFPDTYEIGSSHFGMQILYHLLNVRADVAAERVFAPGTDMAAHMKSSGTPLFSLETRRPLSRFDIIGFSLLYELNYTNVLMMLDLAGLPFYARDRDLRHPLIIAGGPCTVNPEPVAPFFDAMVVGDGEPVLPKMADAWIRWKSGGSRDKTELLKTWAGIEGVYVPAFFRPDPGADGCRHMVSVLPGYEKVRRAVAPDLDSLPFPDAPVVPFGRPVHDRLRLEIARGCTRGCRFCQAGMIYRPVRERSLSRLVSLAKNGICATGYDDLSLLSLSTGDYSRLLPLMKHFSDHYGSSRLAMSIPSFRAGTLSQEMMELIRSVRKTGFTIAPEAGSARLRSVINKNISEAEVFDTMKTAFDLGWQLVKLYFMIGLPSETDADVAGIAELVRRLRKARPRVKRGGNINVSVATFIPKSHVPFQWAAQEDPQSAREKIEFLRARLAVKGVDFKWQDPETSWLEGVFARGDRRLAPVLAAAYNRGCRFDGWSDSFDFKTWHGAFSDAGVDPDVFLLQIPFDAPLPWDHIDTGVSREFLRDEYQKAIRQAPTGDCRHGECQECGVCDFDERRPVNADEKTRDNAFSLQSTGMDTGTGAALRDGPEQRMKVSYTKLGPARYFGHLELANILLRALRRAGIRLAYSGGYHPKPKVAFGDALPVGMESMCEVFFMSITDPSDPTEIQSAVNRQLPEGLAVSRCEPAGKKAAPLQTGVVSYGITLPEGTCFDAAALARFDSATSFEMTVTTKKRGERRIDLKSVVAECVLERSDCLRIAILREPGSAIRPSRAVQSIFALPDTILQRCRILKLAEQCDANPESWNQCDIQRGLHG
ncbi:MAG: TIGR03960 family B12-binding radical SAM protein [Desulfobacteraceae bacterium]|nr:TIGR03960 family B12-binding radical SAM protein [Desulfobacteraceae bacterium]